MIEVRIGKTALEVRGHAGFSGYGSDIVCAAASMLAFALVQAAQTEQWARPPVIETDCGRVRVVLFPTESERKRTEGMLALTGAGYRLLAHRYPNHVQVLREENSEYTG